FGLSQDQRYLFMMTIDGWQAGYSDGALDPETAMWLLQFGAWDAINLDGGGSTAMYRSDCGSEPAPVNHSSYANILGYGRERFARMGQTNTTRPVALPLSPPIIRP